MSIVLAATLFKQAPPINKFNDIAAAEFIVHNQGMEREHAISRIKASEPAIRSLGASALYLFGSTSRNEAGPESDVDIYIDPDTSKPFGMIQLTELEFLLEEILGTEVDLTTRTSLHPMLREEIEKSAIRVL